MENKKYEISPVGVIRGERGIFRITLGNGLSPALKGLEGFSHIAVIWWAHKLDSPQMRTILSAGKPYICGPDEIGVFATRSPLRPNPLCVSVCPVKAIDISKGIIDLYYADADDGTPVIDIKPYQPSADRIRDVSVPAWCAHWPKYLEDSAEFDWQKEFNF
jgi:tRNA-Thr(GGU) m(6)t(6)A37 methyltransferase TsaA